MGCVNGFRKKYSIYVIKNSIKIEYNLAIIESRCYIIDKAILTKSKQRRIRMSRCSNCSYCWQDENDERPVCHYTGFDAWAPCEQDELPEPTFPVWDDYE